jgi:hypothetical protein
MVNRLKSVRWLWPGCQGKSTSEYWQMWHVKRDALKQFRAPWSEEIWPIARRKKWRCILDVSAWLWEEDILWHETSGLLCLSSVYWFLRFSWYHPSICEISLMVMQMFDDGGSWPLLKLGQWVARTGRSDMVAHDRYLLSVLAISDENLGAQRISVSLKLSIWKTSDAWSVRGYLILPR